MAAKGPKKAYHDNVVLLPTTSAALQNPGVLQERFFRYLVQSVTEYAIYMLDLKGHVASWNSGAERVKGYTSEEILGQHFSCFYSPEDRKAGLPDRALRLARETGRFEAEGWRLRKDGVRFWANIMIDPIYDDNASLIGFAKVTRDMTRQKSDAERISMLAARDHLTQLFNRRVFHEALNQKLADRQAGGRLTVLLIDVDDLKAINDTHGHRAGDEILAEIARRLISVFRPEDVVARIGGDEFGVIIGAGSTPKAAKLAERILTACQVPVAIEGSVRIATTVSIGVTTVVIEEGMKQDAVLAQADLALYRAKNDGKSTYRIFSAELEKEIKDRRDMAVDLRKAIASGEGLCINYQPIIDVATGNVVAREALARWNCPVRGPVPPSKFIPLAEELGLIKSLGVWMIDHACMDAKKWNSEIRVSINVSALQLVQGFAEQVLQILQRHDFPARRLEIEVTESVLLHGSSDALHNLHVLKAEGVTVALDDFGVGFSSFSYIRAFPFDRIKIDGSFVRDAGTRQDCTVIVGIIAELGKRLGLTIVAEGVETREQLKLIRSQGCHEVQGYLFGKPASIDSGAVDRDLFTIPA